MMRSLVPILLVIISAVTLASLAFATVQQFTISTYSSTYVVTGINPELLLEYSYANASCTTVPSSNCYQQVSPYTETQIWTGQTTETVPVYSTSTSYVPYAMNGIEGTISVVLAMALLVAGIRLLARNRMKKA